MRPFIPSYRCLRLGIFLATSILGLAPLARDLARGEPAAFDAAPSSLIRSAGSGPWSAPTTWEGGAVPTAGARVQVRAGHTVRYDVASDAVIRSIHVAGTLSFAPDRDTRLDVGLIKIQAGDDASEDGFDCDAHLGRTRRRRAPGRRWRSARPIARSDREHTAVIRLAYVEGMDRQTCPAIVCCGGRMDFHGAPMSRTWVKLGATAPKGDAEVGLAEPVTGWRVGDRVIVTATQGDNGTGGTRRRKPGDKASSTAPDQRGYRTDAEPGVPVYTEERILRGIDGDPPDARPPPRVRAPGRRRLSRRGRQPEPQRRRRVGRPGRSPRPHDVPPRLGRLDLATPSSATWARRACSASTACTSTASATRCAAARSSAPRSGTAATAGSRSTARTTWSSATASATSSVGHGFFLEDGTEVNNVLDRNLAVQAYVAQEAARSRSCRSTRTRGAGFWWANSRNTLHPQRHLRERPLRLPLRGHAEPRARPDLPGPPARRLAPGGRHPHAAVRPVRGQRVPLRRQVRAQPRRGGRSRRPRSPASVRDQGHEDLEGPLRLPAGVAERPGRRDDDLPRRLRRLQPELRPPRLPRPVDHRDATPSRSTAASTTRASSTAP